MEGMIYKYFDEARSSQKHDTSNFWIFWLAVVMALIGVSAVLYGINAEMAVKEIIHIGG